MPLLGPFTFHADKKSGVCDLSSSPFELREFSADSKHQQLTVSVCLATPAELLSLHA